LKLATWQAARFGISGELLDPPTFRPATATAVLDHLLAYVSDVLEDGQEYTGVQRMLREVLERGNGARQQQAVHARTDSLAEVVKDAVHHTLRH
jgi:carboxylate-amine ligase